MQNILLSSMIPHTVEKKTFNAVRLRYQYERRAHQGCEY